MGVSNSDHALDLQIRSGRRLAATLWMPGKRVSAVQFASLVGGTALTEYGPPSAQDLSPSGSDPIHSGWLQGGTTRAFRKGHRTDLTGGQLGRSRWSQG